VSTRTARSPLAKDGPLGERWCRSKYEVRSRLSVSPALYLPLARRKYGGNRGKVVDRDRTEIVIDGFQRSANTFSVTAFQFAQAEPVEVAHHLHAAAQIKAAAAWKIPTVVLIREPSATILSHMIRFPCASARQAIRNWERFYEAVREVRDDVVIADFERVTSDFGKVTEAVNTRFGTTFGVFEHTEANVQRCFELIDERNVNRFGAVEDHTVARPSAARDEMKTDRRTALEAPELAVLRTRVERLYEELVTDREP
jgi:hypothetical protein